MLVPWTDDLPLSEGLPSYPAQDAELERPARRVALTNPSGGPALAAAALWRPDAMRDPDGRPVARIGRFSAVSRQAGAALLAQVCDTLAAEGAKRVVGPMNGSTWFRYRLADAPLSQTGFPGEPPFEPHMSEAFAEAGFTLCERYVSVATDRRPTPGQADVAAAAAGVALTSVAPDTFDAALDDIWAVASAAFVKAPYFQPLRRAAFDTLYAPARLAVGAGATALAHMNSAPVGFMFAFPWGDTLVAKTLAVAPGYEGGGVGAALTLRALEDAARLGLSRTVFATMHADNLSAQWSGERGAVIARYALFGRDL